MKKIFNQMRLIPAIIIVVIMSACSQAKVRDCKSFIPNGATSITAINVASLDKKANLTAEDWKVLTDESDISFNDSGLSTTELSYMFTDSMNNFCFVAKVTDKEKVKAFVKDVIDEFDSLSFNHYKLDGFEVDNSKYFSVSYNKDVCFVLVNIACEDENIIKANTNKYLKGEIETVKADNAEFNKVLSSKNDIAYFMEYVNFLKTFIPASQRAQFDATTNSVMDMNMGGFTNFEVGKIVGELVVSGDYIAKYKDINKPISGVFNQYIPANADIYMSGAMQNNEKTLALLDDIKAQMKAQFNAQIASNPQAAVYLTQFYDVYDKTLDAIWGSINGDLTLYLTAGSMMPQFGIFAQVDNNKLLDFVNEYAKNYGAKMIAKNQYSINIMGMITLMYGVSNGGFYFTNDNATYKAITTNKAITPNFDSTEFYGKIKGTLGGAYFNFDGIMKNMMVMQYASQLPFLSQLQNLEMLSKSYNTSEITLNFTNKTDNSLNVCMKALVNAVRSDN